MKQIFRNKKNLFNHQSLKNVNLSNSKNCYIKDSVHPKHKSYDQTYPNETENISEDTKTSSTKESDILGMGSETGR
jgi:hypothetical protein